MTTLKKSDILMSIYSIFIGIICILFRKLISPEIPQNIATFVGSIFVIIAFLLSFMEIKSKLEFFYSFAENWNGGGIINSGFLLGLGMFFFSSNVMNSIILLIIFNIIFIIERSLIKKFSLK